LHGFSTRHGGTSEGPFATLNLARSVGDSIEHMLENHKRLAATVGYAPDKLFERSQVHGASVYEVREGDDPASVREGQGDALITRVKGYAVGVRVADCVPVLLADTKSGAVAAVHAGWRGVVANVVGATLDALRCEPATVLAAIGPSIGPCCFEVGDEVASQIAEAAGDGIVLRRPPHKPYVDLWRAIEMQLYRAGVRTIDTLGMCTMCDREQWFSFRRDGAQSGRMLAVIVARG
jgi:YfiH family protein